MTKNYKYVYGPTIYRGSRNSRNTAPAREPLHSIPRVLLLHFFEIIQAFPYLLQFLELHL